MGTKPTAISSAALALIAVCAVAVAGCGSSKGLGSGSDGPDPVARAALVTAEVPGYRIAATMDVTTPAGPSHSSLSGVFDRLERTGEMNVSQTLAGQRVNLKEVFSGLTFYLDSSGLDALRNVAGGKRWLKFDMSRLLGSLGLGSLPTTSSDPTQFVDYLRAASSSTRRVGSETVRGVATTHYRATIDLEKYPNLVAPKDRAAAARGVKTLEQALGGRTLPVDAWIDKANLVRRLGLKFSECVSDQRIQFSMDMDLFGYGPQPRPQLPSATDSYDLTPLLTSALGKAKFGCTSG